MSAFRFVHAADLHLDSPLRSLALRDPDLAALIGTATREALSRLVDLCLEEQVDALLLAGDLYDGDQTSMKTARFLADQLGRLTAAGIRCFLIRGNHDAGSRISRELTYPDGIHLFGGRRAEAVTIERGPTRPPVVVHGLSFAKPQAPDSLLDKYGPPVPGAINLGLMHTSLGGSPGHDVYAPCSLADLQRSGFDYWALGHVHKRTVIPGDCTVVMAGMPQGRDINESGPKSVSLVTIEADRRVTVEERITSLAQFERVRVDLTGCEDWRAAVASLGQALEQACNGLASDHLVARLHLTGTTPLAWRLRRQSDGLLLEEARQRAAAIGACWIEMIETDCHPPRKPVGTEAEIDPLDELRQLVEAEVIGSEAFLAELAGLADDLLRKLPPDCRDLLGHTEAEAQTALNRLAQEGLEAVFAHLQGDEPGETA